MYLLKSRWSIIARWLGNIVAKECSNEQHVHCRREELAVMACGENSYHRASLTTEQNVFVCVSEVEYGTCDFVWLRGHKNDCLYV